MNIFITDLHPITSAKNLDDVRLNKMILETAQILNTNNHVLGSGHQPYKPTHANHPSTVWARESFDNMSWLIDHFQALCTEYTTRTGKVHKTSTHLEGFRGSLLDHEMDGVKLPSNRLTPFANCTLDSVRELGLSVVESYQIYMCFKWHFDSVHKWIKLAWKGSSAPSFYQASTIGQYQDLYNAYKSKRLSDKAIETAKKLKKEAKKHKERI
jgi:hypothetical protein